jgi:hypothetical protein
MTQDGTNATIDRLDAALAALEAATARIAGAEYTRADLLESLAVMDDDRQRLADELDSALAHARVLETANGDAERMLDEASRRLTALIGDGPG